jgi:uncharacterized protein YdcH (DUF465 family)
MGKKGNGKEREDIIQDLLEKNEEFKKAFEVHKNYESKLADLNSRGYLTTEDQLERKKLQKRKLMEKDRMELIIQKHKSGV